MLHLKIKRDINQTIKDNRLGLINKNLAIEKLNNLYKEKDLCPKGYKREVKNEIYKAKKMIKFF